MHVWIDFTTQMLKDYIYFYLQFSPIISSNTLTHSQDDEEAQIVLEDLKTHLF